MASFTKKAICQSFIKLLSERPIDKITVKDIVDDCGIARNTFYYHYQDIYQVLEDILDQRVQDAVKRMKKEAAGWEKKSSEQNLRDGFKELKEHGNVFYNMFQSAGEGEVRRYLLRTSTVFFNHLVEIRAQGIEASEEDKKLIASFFRNAISGYMAEWLDSGMKMPIDEMLNRIGQLFGDSITEALRRSEALCREADGKKKPLPEPKNKK